VRKREKLAKIMELAEDGLHTNEDCHKQWYLEEIFKLAGGDLAEIDGLFEEGIAP